LSFISIKYTRSSALVCVVSFAKLSCVSAAIPIKVGVIRFHLTYHFFWGLPNTGSTSEFIPSLSKRSIQASALILSPTDIAWQNIMYNAKCRVHFLLLASSSASSDKELLLLLSPTLLSLFLTGCIC